MADKPKDEEEIKSEEEVTPSEPAPSQPPEDKKSESEEKPAEDDKNVEPEPGEEAEEEEEKPPSRRESLRIQQLLEKLKEKPQTPAPDNIGGMDFKTALDANPEVIKQLEDDRKTVADSQFQQGLKQAQSIQFHTRLEIDAPRVEVKYPQLDKESADFKPVVANAINQWYLNTVGYDPATDTVVNPGVRYSDFVDGIMELAGEVGSEKTNTASKNIAKQAANTAIRPGGGRTKGLDLNKAPEQMSDEELKAVLAQAGL
jgi:hypothetical protein